jgi:hypothetical protein
MTITITQNTFGFHLAIASDDRQRFAQVIESFKLAIPKCNRRFNEISRIWFVDKRAEPKMRRFLESVKQAGETKIIEFDKSKSLLPDEAA